MPDNQFTHAVIRCAKCGKPIKSSSHVEGNCLDISVDPCVNCLDEAKRSASRVLYALEKVVDLGLSTDEIVSGLHDIEKRQRECHDGRTSPIGCEYFLEGACLDRTCTKTDKRCDFLKKVDEALNGGKE